MPPVYGVMGEDDSDVDSLRAFIKRLRDDAEKPSSNITIHRKGYEGCAEMLRKGAGQLRAWERAGVTRVVVSYDADRDKPTDRIAHLEAMVAESDITIDHCLLVPVQELEAWLLADVVKLEDLFTVLRKRDKRKRIKPIVSPETINDPKEHLIKLSRHPKNNEALYHPPTHNVWMAEHVDLVVVQKKCKSFRPLVTFLANE